MAAIDWALLETVLALGATPVGATELIQFRRLAVEPPVPPLTADLGLRGTPNYELLRLISPDLILISNFYEYQRSALERVAPVLSFPLFLAGRSPYAEAETAARVLSERLGLGDAGARLAADTSADLERLRRDLAPVSGRPVFAVSVGDSGHVRAFGTDSLFGNAMERLGLRNAWNAPSQYGAAAPVGLMALADAPDAFVAIVPPVPPDVEQGLKRSALWNALPPVRAGRVATLDPVNHFGALPAARRFARSLAGALLDGSARG